MPRLVDLTHAMQHGQAAFPSDPTLSIVAHGTIETLQYNISRIEMGSHHGTHLDAMRHFIPAGRPIDQMPLDWFYGPAHVLRIPKSAGQTIDLEDLEPFRSLLKPGAKIIYETGWHRRYGQPDYFTAFPSLTQSAARLLADTGIRMLGMDTPTPSNDWYEVHHILLAPPGEVVIVESLANLDQVPDTFTFVGFPLKFQGGDGSPIRAVALCD